jgi:hypothetical protein
MDCAYNKLCKFKKTVAYIKFDIVKYKTVLISHKNRLQKNIINCEFCQTIDVYLLELEELNQVLITIPPFDHLPDSEILAAITYYIQNINNYLTNFVEIKAFIDGLRSTIPITPPQVRLNPQLPSIAVR